MIGVCRASAQQVPEQIPGDDRIDGSATDTFLCLFRNPAGSHRAVTTAHSLLPKTALRLLGFQPIPGNGELRVARQIDHLLRGWIQ
jgi:hypothetical protein